MAGCNLYREKGVERGQETHRELLEPLPDLPVNCITFLIHNLRELGVHIAEHLEHVRARIECISCSRRIIEHSAKNKTHKSVQGKTVSFHTHIIPREPVYGWYV